MMMKHPLYQENSNPSWSINVNVESILNNDEQIIWSSLPYIQHYPHHYGFYVTRMLLLLVALFLAGYGSAYLWSATSFILFHTGVFALCGSSLFVAIWITYKSIFSKSTQCVYTITNTRVFVYDPKTCKLLDSCNHNTIEKIKVNKLGNESNIICTQVQTSSLPFVFSFVGVDNLAEIAQLLYEQTGINPSYPNPKR
jgi:hypothetical protein